MEMCDCFVDLIDQHNGQIDAMYRLGERLLLNFPEVEKTEVNDIFCEVMNGMMEQSVQLCAIANCVSDVEWYMDEEGFVLTDGTNDEESECCDGPRISDYLN
jgi:hypothetical protein